MKWKIILEDVFKFVEKKMDNQQKYELRKEVIRLDIVGYNKKQIINILESRGFKRQTISRYYNSLCSKTQEKEDEVGK